MKRDFDWEWVFEGCLVICLLLLVLTLVGTLIVANYMMIKNNGSRSVNAIELKVSK